MIDVDIEQRLGVFDLAVRFAAEAPIVGLFGRSGAGKSSVINAVAGITTPARGHIRINDVTLFDAAAGVDLPPEKRRIGYVFQDGLLFPHMDVAANLLYGQRLRRAEDRRIDEARVVDLLGLQDLLRRKPKMLSGGEKQRVAIGRALLAQPRILLLDEPLAALDMARKAEILDYIERLRDELSIPIVYVSHSVTEIARLADTVVVLSEGRCVAAGDVDEVMGRLDVQSATGRYEAGALIETRVAGYDPDGQLTTLAFAGGELVVPRLNAAVGERVRARIRARDVAIATQRPQGISMLNILRGSVAVVEMGQGPLAEVQIVVGRATLNARITRRSLRDLDIRVGQDVYALVKAVSFDERSVSYVHEHRTGSSG